MIQPDVIRRKAVNLYPKYLRAWLDGEPFFPRDIPSNKKLDENLATAAESVQRLRSGSKESLGYGYTVEWETINSRRHGRNEFPQRVLFETPADLLKFIGKEREFSQFTAAVSHLRERYPQLESWIRSHRKELIDAAAEIESLVAVVDYFVAHPRPERFARELPLAVDTKFIERNQRLLRAWLDIVLPPHAIRADEEHFARRFGLRYVEQPIWIRYLDDGLKTRSGMPWSEFALPLRELANQPLVCDRVIIVENQVPLRTLPSLTNAIAIGGLGNGVTDLRYVTWLSSRDVWYWGDLDVEGFDILSRLRTLLPHVRSFLMDAETLTRWHADFATPGTGRDSVPAHLTEEESTACRHCATKNLRIEQERIPQEYVLSSLPHLTNN